MRFIALIAILSLAPLTGVAQSDTAPRVGKNYAAGQKLHVRMQVDADHLALPVTVTIKGKDRAVVDARIEAIRTELEKRFKDQPGWGLREISVEFAHSEAKSYASRASTGSKLFGDDDIDKGDVTYVANARWELHAAAEKGLKGVETLRTKAADLVKTKSDDEKQIIGNPEYILTNPHDYRNGLLDQIKNDFEEAKKHLPEGQWTLEIASLAQSVDTVALGGKRFEVSLAYRMAFVTPKPEKATK